METDKTSLLTKVLLERLDLSNWPLGFKDLPIGCALVGGAVRDGLLMSNKFKPDLDFIVPSQAIQFAEELSHDIGGTCIVLDQERDIARIVLGDWTIDFARQVGNSLIEDLSRRDFTINSIALTFDSQPQILDPFNGIQHLKERRLVAVSERNLTDDPLRILRGFRFMSELNLDVEEKTKFLLEAHSRLLSGIAPERIQNEIKKLIVGDSAESVIHALNQIDLLSPWANKSKVFISPLNISEHLKEFNSSELEIALTFSRLVDLISEDGLIKLRFSRKEIQVCRNLRKWLKKNDGLAFKTLNESDLFQLHVELESYLPALILSLPIENQMIWLRRWRDKKDPLFHPSPPVDGFVLQEVLGVPPGPALGEILSHLSKEKAFNRLHTFEEAVELARYLWKQKQPLL